MRQKLRRHLDGSVKVRCDLSNDAAIIDAVRPKVDHLHNARIIDEYVEVGEIAKYASGELFDLIDVSHVALKSAQAWDLLHRAIDAIGARARYDDRIVTSSECLCHLEADA